MNRFWSNNSLLTWCFDTLQCLYQEKTSSRTYTYTYSYRICFTWPWGHKRKLTWVYFPSVWFLQNINHWGSFRSASPGFSNILLGPFRAASWHQHIYIYRIHFPWPCGPKHILTWVYFPSAWFLQFLLEFVLLSLTAPLIYIYIYIYKYINIHIYIYQKKRKECGDTVANYK